MIARATLLALLLASGDQSAPLVVLGVGAQADAVARALEGRGESVTRMDTAATLVTKDAALLAADAASCAALAGAAATARACVLVARDRVPTGVPAVTADVALAVEFLLLARAFPGRTRVLVLRHPGRAAGDAELSAAAQQAGLQLTVVDVRSPGEAVPALTSALRGPGAAPILLALPDPAVFTADSVAPLTQASMSARVPLVGFSPYFLKVGAVAAFIPDIEDAALAALHLLRAPTPGSTPVVSAARATLVVDGRLAARLGISVRAGPDIEVRK